jgi:hypothetical protein
MILGLGLAIAWGAAASAQEPLPLTAPNLAFIDAVIHVCRELAPAEHGDYRALKVSLFGQQSDPTFDALERTPQYRQTFALVRASLGETPRYLLRLGCLDAIGAAASDERRRE